MTLDMCPRTSIFGRMAARSDDDDDDDDDDGPKDTPTCLHTM